MNYRPPHRPLSPTFGPLQRRLLALAGLLAVLMIGLIVFHALHTGQTGLNAVAEAAERTARQPGAKLAMEVRYTVESAGVSKTVTGRGSGAFNARTGRALASLTISVPDKGPMSIVTVADEKRIFLRSPTYEAELPPGKDWLGMEPYLGHSTETAFGSNGSAQSQLELLSTVGDGVEEVGEETVRGHLTTRYEGTVELAKAAELLSERGERELAEEFERFAEAIPDPIPVEAWIDDMGLTRQMRVVEPLPSSPGGPTVTMDMRMQLFSFGAQPKIKLPAKRAVFDFTPILRAELGLEDGSTLGPLTPPAGAKPLSATEFRKRATTICRKVYGEAEDLLDRGRGVADAIKRIKPGQEERAKSLVRRYAERVGRPAVRKDRQLFGELVALRPPESLADDYRRYLEVNATETEWLGTQIRVAELGSLKFDSLEARETQHDEEEAETKRLAAGLGIPSCEKDLSGEASTADSTAA